MGEVRNFSRADAAAVASLFQKTFRDASKAPPPSLEAYLADVHLGHPDYDPDVSARVHVDAEGRITGFIGVVPGRFEHRGSIYRAAIAGSLMVEDRERDPLAGAKLLRSVVRGPQDISISESTNLLSQGLWEQLGGKLAPLLSLDWLRVLRPAAAAVSLVAEKVPSAALLASSARAGDWMAGAWTRRLRPPEPRAALKVEAEATDAQLAAAVLELASQSELRPAWDERDVLQRLAHASGKERYGPCRRAIVRDAKGRLAGCWLYHGRKGGAGRVLQFLARRDAVEATVDCLLRDADGAGLAALRGRITPQLFNTLLKRQCIFVHRASTMIHTKNAALAQTVLAGDALITGLAGESWTRLIGGEFR